ncbi:MAG TPA: chorismate-binding protein [Limnobacter sp.]|nr:chorismate-binding protein [Limnobacter sp.]
MTSSFVSAAWHAGMSGPGGADSLLVAHGAPEQVLVAYEAALVPVLLDRAHELARQGRYVVGGLSYEAASAFDSSLSTHAACNFPLLEFHVFMPTQVSRVEASSLLPLPNDTRFSPWTDKLGLSGFYENFEKIRQAILDGEFYQLNFTTRLHSRSPSLDAWLLFQHLYLAQPAPQSLFLRGSGFNVLSLSPELFFSWDGQELNTAPMKGTRRPLKDGFDRLSDSEKDRAENVMIVDLLRNDLAKVCEPRTVQVRSLFDVMHLPTVEQMTSSISGRTRPGTRLVDVFAALFPCGSVTGAPKSQAMLRIADWEQEPRRFYCGALGVINPGGLAHFNVPIRTVIEQQGQMEYGVGSGLTWYSTAQAEKQEWAQKTAFLRQVTCDFQLLETLRLERGLLENLDLHLDRMARAAAYFSYPFVRQAIHGRLLNAAEAHPNGAHRVRILLNAQGEFELQVFPLLQEPAPTRLRMASAPMTGLPEFIVHKTTYRPDYEAFQAEAAGATDVLLFSPQGFLTETCRFNLVLKVGDQLLTPKISDSTDTYLLPGVLRHRLLMENTIQESALTVHDLQRAEQVWLINSLRGWVRVNEVLDQEDKVLFSDKAI